VRGISTRSADVGARALLDVAVFAGAERAAVLVSTAEAAVNLPPHRLQYKLIAGLRAAHLGQTSELGEDKAMPQFLQYLVSSRLEVPQFAQLIMFHPLLENELRLNDTRIVPNCQKHLE
jgi:hypothetical protein